MIKLEPIVKKWYEALDNDKMMGYACQECGAMEFPPVYCCNACSSTDMAWKEISGEAEMLDFVLTGPIAANPMNKALMPYCLASVKLAEGPSFYALVAGVSKDNKKELNEKLPVPVRAEILQREGFRTIVFRLVTE